MQELIDSILALKKELGNGGPYSICMSNSEPLGLVEAIRIGNVLERIDKAIENATNLKKEN